MLLHFKLLIKNFKIINPWAANSEINKFYSNEWYVYIYFFQEPAEESSSFNHYLFFVWGKESKWKDFFQLRFAIVRPNSSSILLLLMLRFSSIYIENYEWYQSMLSLKLYVSTHLSILKVINLKCLTNCSE